ncbi:MAG TPA: hypothetical protein VHJ58_10000 [Vicinamibacterales bacterium]|nr:hypothetical protein [Vicinamibacterales bacterium]
MRTGWVWNRAPTRWVLVTACAFLAHQALAAGTVLDFENLPTGTTVTDQFASQGVTFSSAYLAEDRAARSGTRVLRTVSPAAEVFTPIPLRMAFTTPQARVRLFATSPGTARNGTLSAFDASGAVIARDGPKLVAADAYTTMFETTVAAPGITRAELQLEGASHYAIDDLEFDSVTSSEAAPPRIVEMRQPSAEQNAAVTGKIARGWDLGNPPEVAGGKRPDPPGEIDERVEIDSVPLVERDLPPGATAELRTRVKRPAGLAGSARWIGTATPLPLTLSLNGSPVATGKAYALGTTRGGSDVGAVAKTASNVKLSVTNTSKVRVKVRLTLGIVPGQDQ